jgi:adenine-specific DNA-methyltransferase
LEKVGELIEKLQETRPPINEAEATLKQLYKDGNYDRGVTLYNCLDENYRPWGKINMSWPNASTFGPRYEVLHPLTGRPVKIPDRGWRWKEETFKAQLANGARFKRYDGSVIVGRIWFAKDEKTQPSSILYLQEVNRILLRSVLSLKSDGGIELEKYFGTKSSFAYPKPTSLIKTLVDSLKMQEGDIVMDSFAGSGTTAEAVLQLNKRDQVKRHFILIELSSKVALETTRVRVKRVAEGFQSPESGDLRGVGGGFRYVRLGDELFDEHGRINETKVRFGDLALHVYFSETGEPLPKERISSKTPLLGVHHGRAVYLLYNGILKDKSVDGGNVLTTTSLKHLPAHDGPKVVYAAGCRFSKARLERENITFKQTPYSIRTS